MNKIRQGYSLSPMIFNLVMDKLIDNVKTTKGYKMGKKNLNILCYAEEAVLIVDTENNL